VRGKERIRVTAIVRRRNGGSHSGGQPCMCVIGKDKKIAGRSKAMEEEKPNSGSNEMKP